MVIQDSKNMKPLTYFDKALPKKQCETCAKKIVMAGQAFTRYECAICSNISLHGNTAVPKVCRPCANKLNCCETCGGVL